MLRTLALALVLSQAFVTILPHAAARDAGACYAPSPDARPVACAHAHVCCSGAGGFVEFNVTYFAAPGGVGQFGWVEGSTTGPTHVGTCHGGVLTPPDPCRVFFPPDPCMIAVPMSPPDPCRMVPAFLP